jgi:hypothetical protein
VGPACSRPARLLTRALASHGILTVGKTVDSAVGAFILLEDACRVQLLADAAAGGRGGQTVKIGEEEAAFTFKATGTDGSMWFMSQSVQPSPFLVFPSPHAHLPQALLRCERGRCRLRDCL